MRQSSSRNHRSRGWKVKHVLQVCLLVAVCVWLLYQVKHSNDKKKALQEGALKVTDGVEESRHILLKWGRKDPQENPVVTAGQNSPHSEEEENEEPEEAADQESKKEGNEEEDGRGAGDDEIDESDQERGDDEAEGGEEFGDEDDKERRSDDVSLLENEDHEDDEVKSQGAREENYKADDASSAVVRDTQEMVHENGELGARSLDEEEHKENLATDGLENDDRTNVTEMVATYTEMHDVLNNGQNLLNNTTLLNDLAAGENKPEVELLQNATMALESSDHIEEQTAATSNSSDHMAQHDNSTIVQTPSENEQVLNSMAAALEEHRETQNASTITESSDQYEQQSNSTETTPEEQMGVQNASAGDGGATGVSTRENETATLDPDQDQTGPMNETRFSTEIPVDKGISFEQTEQFNSTRVEQSVENHITKSIANGSYDAINAEINDSSDNVVSVAREDFDAQADLSTLLPEIQMDTRKEEDLAAE